MEELHRPDAAPGGGIPPTPHVDDRSPEASVEQKFLEHFGLSEQPFGVTPDPRFLYLGTKHKQALAALTYGTELNRGFLTLIAPPGLGKTSLLFNYLEGLRDKARTVYVFQTNCDARELMAYILAELGVNPYGKDLPEMHAMLNQVLLEEMRLGRRFVLVIDEAQNLSEGVLESVRLLSNFETPWMKLMQIVLAGQPQLADRLAEPSMAQLRQRVSLAAQIEPLSSEEVGAYIDHRLWVAGYKGTPLFSVGARSLLAEHSEGVPRRINHLCFCAMSFAWATKKETIDREMMREVLAGMNVIARPPKAEAEAEPVPSIVESPKAIEKPGPSVMLQGLQSPILTVKEPPTQGWLPKIAAVAVFLAALAWFGVRLDVGKRLMIYWDGISAAEKVGAAPSHEQVPGSLATAPARDDAGTSGSGALSTTDSTTSDSTEPPSLTAAPASHQPN